ncbi:MAG: hypothetical protein Q9218_001833 [Villophora microphyllina]
MSPINPPTTSTTPMPAKGTNKAHSEFPNASNSSGEVVPSGGSPKGGENGTITAFTGAAPSGKEVSINGLRKLLSLVALVAMGVS